MLHRLLHKTSGVTRYYFSLALPIFLTLQACVVPQFCIAEEAKVKEQVLVTVEPFYSWVLAHRFVSLPTDKERSELAVFLMPDLIQLMKDAEEMQSRCFKAAQEGDKPLMFEGALLVSNHEGATEVSYGEPKTDRHLEGVVTLPIILVHIEELNPKGSRFRTHAWNEKLELRQKGGKWLINNISFLYGESLRSILQNYISNGRRECGAP